MVAGCRSGLGDSSLERIPTLHPWLITIALIASFVGGYAGGYMYGTRVVVKLKAELKSISLDVLQIPHNAATTIANRVNALVTRL